METTIKSTAQQVQVSESSTKSFWDAMAFNYFAVITFTLTVGSIFGGVATMFILQADAPTWQLVLCAMFSMGSNVAAISSAPVKVVVTIFSLSVILNSIMILINAF